MKRTAWIVLACAMLGACRVKGPVSADDLPTTASTQTGLMRLTVSKAGPNLMNVVLGEDLNFGFNPKDRYLKDGVANYQGLLVQIVNFACNPRGFAIGVEFPNGVNKETNKNEVHFQRLETCGNRVEFAIRADEYPHQGNWRWMTFPDRDDRILRSPSNMRFEQKDGQIHVIIDQF